MLLSIVHETRLSYTEPVTESVLEVRKAPASDEDQTNLGYRLWVSPSVPVTSFRDGFGNRVDLFNVLVPHRELTIRATTVARIHRRDGAARLAEADWQIDEPAPVDVIEYLQHSPLVGRSAMLSEFLGTLPRASSTPLSKVVEQVVTAVRSRLTYEKKVTTARTPVGEALTLGRGVCQDFAHLFIASCRGLGVPARYVSGYVSGPGELATHAWCQVWAGRAGWIDIDPTHDTFATDLYVVTAVGRDFSDVPPNRGVWKGCADETITVSVKAEPIDRIPLNWSEWGSSSQRPSQGWTQQAVYPKRPYVPGQQRNGYRQQQSQQQQ